MVAAVTSIAEKQTIALQAVGGEKGGPGVVAGGRVIGAGGEWTLAPGSGLDNPEPGR
jgi:hypothetical protein